MNQINVQVTTKPPPNALSPGLLAAVVVALLGYLAVRTPEPARLSAGITAAPATAAVLGPCAMDRPGLLHGQIFGSLSLVMDWQGPDLRCAGGPRPANKGLRLYFAGKPPGGSEVVLVLGIDGDIASLAGSERAVGITLNDEGTHRFFHADAGRCFTRVSEVQPLPGQAGQAGRNFRIDGVAWCVGALPSVSDNASITLGDLHYSGRLSVDADQ